MDSRNNIYLEVVENFVLYLVKKGYDKEDLKRKLKKTIFCEFKSNRKEYIYCQYKDEYFEEEVRVKNAYAFQSPCIKIYKNEVINPANIIGINKATQKNILRGVMIHELLHLFSQSFDLEQKYDEYILKCGFLEERYMNKDGKLKSFCYSKKMDNMNEGVTQFLCKNIYKEIYGEELIEIENYIYSDFIHIINAFITKDGNFNWLLDLYLNSDYDKFLKILNTKLSIENNFFKKVRIKVVYYETSRMFTKYQFGKIVKQFIENYKKYSKDKDDYSMIIKTIKSGINEDLYSNVIEMLDKNLV